MLLSTRSPPASAPTSIGSLERKSLEMGAGYQKISVNLSTQVLSALREMAAQEAVTLTEILRRAISTHKFVEEVQHEGKSIYVHDPETNQSERVIFR